MTPKGPPLKTKLDRAVAAIQRVLIHEDWKDMCSEESRAVQYLDTLAKLRAVIAENPEIVRRIENYYQGK